MLVYLYELHIKCMFCSAPQIFVRVMALEFLWIYHNLCFPHFFSKCWQILSWLLVCKSTLISYRSSISFVALRWFLSKNFEKNTEILSFPFFFLNACRYWAFFLECESTFMSYRSSLRFLPFCWFFSEVTNFQFYALYQNFSFHAYFPKKTD